MKNNPLIVSKKLLVKAEPGNFSTNRAIYLTGARNPNKTSDISADRPDADAGDRILFSGFCHVSQYVRPSVPRHHMG
ncbi:hypothetical protein [Phyllobacterium phragmitis]|uniref:hypothetical protein n=1 Tax=Phyllobacterium phragmitis TaxID=2670329 RepID=UPI0011B20758|nr:hypothetical protein [Phyllobacterium phragmitis]